MTTARALAPWPVRMLAFVLSLVAVVLILVLSDGDYWGIVALLPALLALEVGRRLWRDRHSG